MSEIDTNAAANLKSINSLEALRKYPVIAGFWLRFVAFLIDSVLLGLLGLIIGGLFFTTFSSLGPYGRLIGLAFSIPYFGIMNSKLSNGQTIGKKIFNIAVRNNQNESIGLGRSLLRITIIMLPTYLNGLAIPILQNVLFTWFANVMIFGIGGALLYTMVFNKKARQGLHDLLLGTYVISLSKKSADDLPKTKKVHYIISISWIAAVIVFISIFLAIQPSRNSTSSTNETQQLYTVLLQNKNVLTAGISTRTDYSPNENKQQGLIVTLWLKGKLSPGDGELVCKETATTVLKNVKNIDKFDYLTIRLTTGYDIGISKWMSTRNCSGTIQKWIETINSAD